MWTTSQKSFCLGLLSCCSAKRAHRLSKVPVSTLYRWKKASISQASKKKRAGKSSVVRQKRRRREEVWRLASVIEKFFGSPGRSGRAQKRIIERRKYNTLSKIAHALQPRFVVCRQTILNDLKIGGYKCYSCPWGPIRNEADAQKRIEMAQRVLRTPHDKYLFVDEKFANCNEAFRRSEYRQAKDHPSHRTRERFTPTVHFAAAIARDYRFICALPCGGIDAPTYKRLFLQKITPTLLSRGLTLCSDGARPHKAEAQQYLINKHVNVLPWSPRSPDLNPIERVFAWVELAVSYRSPPPMDADTLRQYWVEEFNRIPQAQLNSLCADFRLYCRECVARQGATIVTSRAMKVAVRNLYGHAHIVRPTPK